MRTRPEWQTVIGDIIFEHDTPAAKAFDVVLLWTIALSIVAVMLESVGAIDAQYGSILRALEWVFTFLFTVEYVARLLTAHSRIKYVKSFFGVVDLLAIMPTYLSIFFPGAHYLLSVRALRLLRVFRVLKMLRYIGEANLLMQALVASRRKITVFLYTVFTMVIIIGTLMYLIEGRENGFTSIPQSVYWAIVTLTTVGYGDISPVTVLGKTLACFVMIIGYAIIAVPTGIVTVELSKGARAEEETNKCSQCGGATPVLGARFCAFCGTAAKP